MKNFNHYWIYHTQTFCTKIPKLMHFVKVFLGAASLWWLNHSRQEMSDCTSVEVIECNNVIQYMFSILMDCYCQHILQTSNMRRRRFSVGNTIFDQSDIVGASPVGAAPITSSFATPGLTPGFNELRKVNSKTRHEMCFGLCYDLN